MTLACLLPKPTLTPKCLCHNSLNLRIDGWPFLALHFCLQMGAESPHVTAWTKFCPHSMSKHTKNWQEQNLYAFLNSPRALGNMSAQLNPTLMPESIFALTNTHILRCSPTSQWGLVLRQVRNWQTGKSQIILSQLDRDGLNVKMLLGSLRPELPKLWMMAKTCSTALCYSVMCGRRDSKDVHEGPHASSGSVFGDRVRVKSQVFGVHS